MLGFVGGKVLDSANVMVEVAVAECKVMSVDTFQSRSRDSALCPLSAGFAGAKLGRQAGMSGPHITILPALRRHGPRIPEPFQQAY